MALKLYVCPYVATCTGKSVNEQRKSTLNLTKEEIKQEMYRTDIPSCILNTPRH